MKKFRKVVSIALMVGFVYACVMFGLVWSGRNDVGRENPEKIIVLGTTVLGKNQLDASPSVALKERLDATVTILRENPSSSVVVTGGKVRQEPVSEASFMGEYLRKHGISANRITEESKARNTVENMKNSLRYVKHSKNTLILTSDFHAYRSLMLAKRIGIPNVSLQAVRCKSPYAWLYYLRDTLALGVNMVVGR